MEHAARSNRFVGRPVERIEDLRFLRGRGQYIDDLAPEGVLHAVITAQEIAHQIAPDSTMPIPVIPMRQEPTPQLKPYEQPVIAHGKVRYVGEPIALVVADSAAFAEDSLEAIDVDIEPLAAVA